jgi:hypothetical protein
MFLKDKMKSDRRTDRLRILTILLTLFVVTLVPVPAMARVNVDIGIVLPPPIVAEPPAVVVLPGAPGVYVAPDISVDLYFWNGWWWRPWNGRWFRSRHYDGDWSYYRRGVPGFYSRVNPRWRGYYKDHRWNDRPWHYRRIPHREFQHRHYRR